MIVSYWGVRGSMPSPGLETVRYGGNTACVSVELGNDVLIIDTGTGIRPLGKYLAGTDKRIFIAQSHIHLDHVVGFPLFAPLFEEGRPIYLIGFPQGERRWTPLDLMDGAYWPVNPRDLRSRLHVVGDEGFAMLAREGLQVELTPVNHPGGAFGFRVTDGRHTFVHVTDNELYPPGEPTITYDEMTEFCRGADVLTHDAQYLENEMPMKEGWGHSLATTACRLAIDSDVRCLVLYHHDPDRTDAALDRIGSRSELMLQPHRIRSIVAYEGLTLNLNQTQFVAAGPPASRESSQ